MCPPLRAPRQRWWPSHVVPPPLTRTEPVFHGACFALFTRMKRGSEAMGKDWPRSHGQDRTAQRRGLHLEPPKAGAALSALHGTGWDRNQRNGRGQAAPKQTCGAGVTILICPPAPWPEQPQGTVVLCGLLPLFPASLPVTSACHVGNNGLTPGMVGIQNSRSQRARSQALPAPAPGPCFARASPLRKFPLNPVIKHGGRGRWAGIPTIQTLFQKQIK